MTVTVKGILEKYLRENGYDGLYAARIDCGCSLRDGLIPCDGWGVEACKAGIFVHHAPGDRSGCARGDACDCIGERKGAPND